LRPGMIDAWARYQAAARRLRNTNLSAGVKILSLPDVTFLPRCQSQMMPHNTDASSCQPVSWRYTYDTAIACCAHISKSRFVHGFL